MKNENLAVLSSCGEGEHLWLLTHTEQDRVARLHKFYKERIVLAYDVNFEEACSARRGAEVKYYGQVKDG